MIRKPTAATSNTSAASARNNPNPIQRAQSSAAATSRHNRDEVIMLDSSSDEEEKVSTTKRDATGSANVAPAAASSASSSINRPVASASAVAAASTSSTASPSRTHPTAAGSAASASAAAAATAALSSTYILPPSSFASSSSSPSASGIQSGFNSILLPYHKSLISNFESSDGLLVLGKGLGGANVWAGFMERFARVQITPGQSSSHHHHLHQQHLANALNKGTTSNPNQATTQQDATVSHNENGDPLNAAANQGARQMSMLMYAQTTNKTGLASSAASASIPPSLPPPSPFSASPYLIFLLNFSDDRIQWLNHIFQTYHTDANADPHHRSRTRGIRIINNEFNVSERQSLYLQGGLLSITSRILTVDLLNYVISPVLISGFYVDHAHAIHELAPEAFILRIWRKENKKGWIKAMSEEPQAFTRTMGGGGSGNSTSGGGKGARVASTFGSLEICMKSLFVRKVWLCPRWSVMVNNALSPAAQNSHAQKLKIKHEGIDIDEEEQDVGIQEAATATSSTKSTRPSLDIIELHQPFTPLMTAIQSALIEVIDTLITQLKTENKNFTVWEPTSRTTTNSGTGGAAAGSTKSSGTEIRPFDNLNLSIESGLLRNFDSLLRSELGGAIHGRLSSKTHSILKDLTSLRSCIGYLISYDCVTFYRYLLLIKQQAVGNTNHGHSTWLLSESAERLFKLARQRVFVVHPAMTMNKGIKGKKESVEKKEQQRIERSTRSSKPKSGGGTSHADAMEISSDEDESADSKPTISHHSPSSSSSSCSTFDPSVDNLDVVLEENPKWDLLVDTLAEIQEEVCNRAKEFEKKARESKLTEIMEGIGTSKNKEKKVKAEGGSASSDTSTRGNSCNLPLHLPPQFGRTLLLVRDNRTATFLTRLLTIGGRNLLKSYWKKYLFSLKLHRRVVTMPPTTTGSSSSAAAASSSNATTAPTFISTSTNSTSIPSQLHASFARETFLLRRELDSIMDNEAMDRSLQRMTYAQELHAKKTQELQRKQREEDLEFDLKEPEPTGGPGALQPTLPQQIDKHKRDQEAKSKLNPFKAAQRESSIEALEMEIDELTSTGAATHDKPKVVFEPSIKTQSKRSAASTTQPARKRQKKDTEKDTKADENNKDDENEEEGEQAENNKHRQDDAADPDALLAAEDEDEREIRAMAASRSRGQLSAAGSTDVPLSGLTSSSFMFDRSDLSVIDPSFHMDSLPPMTSGTHTSPYFSKPGVASSSSIAPDAPSTDSALPLTSSSTVTVLPSFQLLIHPLTDLHVILHQYHPEYVLLFDPDLEAIRELEVFQSLPSTTWSLHVYFLLYANSMEETRYTASIQQENKAFDTLIQTKKIMVVPVEQDGKLAAPVLDPAMDAAQRKINQLYDDGIRNATYEAYASTLPKVTGENTRRGGTLSEAPPTILVDVREFRSSLPSLLHANNFTLLPLTLSIADYILTPTLAIERKSIPDLIGSLNNGRLYKQMEQATRYYKTPILLIEFDRGRNFALIQPSDMGPDIDSRSVISKLVLVFLHFPSMRVLWSRDSKVTASLFRMLKQNQPQPTVEQAITAGVHLSSIKAQKVGFEFADIDEAGSSGLTEEEREEKNLSLTPHDMLRKMPGVNANNIRNILSHIPNLRQLCETPLKELAKYMGGMIFAKKLWNFLHEEPGAQCTDESSFRFE